MKTVLALAAAAAAATGTVLVAYSPILVRLFGADIGGAGEVMSRIAGIALVGPGVACWPDGSTRPALHGMRTYGILAVLYLVYVGVRGEWVGVLLWPAVAAHALLVMLLRRARSQEGTRSVGMGA